MDKLEEMEMETETLKGYEDDLKEWEGHLKAVRYEVNRLKKIVKLQKQYIENIKEFD